MTKSFHRASFVLLMLLAAATSGRAQTTTGRLIGSVVDESGAPLPGVNVTVASPALIGGAQTRPTDDRGEFSFIGIAPGEYTVRAELAGFIAQERGEVKVPLGGAAAITIAMPGGTFAGEIQVVDETPMVDPTQVNANQIFERSYMQQSAIGSVNRDYLTIVNQAAGVAGGGVWLQPQPRVFGSTIGENAYFIDGMDTTDPVMATATVRMNFDTIAEIQLLTGGFEAEYGRATGGIVNVVTRSGGNQFSGALDVRYRDQSFQEGGDHFDTSELDTSFQQYSFTLGGPILRDRLWFFSSYRWVDEASTPDGSPLTSDSEGEDYLGKITWQIHPAWRVVGKYSSDPLTLTNGNASRWVMPEAGASGDFGTKLMSAEISAVLSESLLWNTTLGRYDYGVDVHPDSGDLQTIGHYNYVTGMATHNYSNQQYWTSTRGDLATDVTWFIDDLVGSHEFKGGIQYSDLTLTNANCFTGTPNGERCVKDGVGFFFDDVTNDEGSALPWDMGEYHTTGPVDYTGTVSTAFVQDSWRPAPDVTLKIGLRYDRVTYNTNDGTKIADSAKYQPRLGVAWDITGNARSVIRGSWGRFVHPNGLTLPIQVTTLNKPWFRWYSCSGYLPFQLEIPVDSADDCAAIAADLGWDYRLDNEGWDPYGWVLAPSEHHRSEPSRPAPDIRATYADELIVAFERQITDGSSLELTFVDKATRDIVDTTCNGNWPTPSPDAACDFMILGNIPTLRRDYRGFIVRLETRSLDWLTLLASYTYSTSKGSTEYTQNGALDDADVYPWHFENRYGYLSDHRTHRLKLNGFVTLPGDWNIAFDGFWSSPFTWTPYEDHYDNQEIPWGSHFLEPRGNRDASNSYQLDLQLAKGFSVGPVRLVLIGSVYNVFSDEQPITVCEHISGCGDIAMGEPTDWQTPRRYELGFRVEF